MCSSDLITFGNLKDDGSAVSKLQQSPRAYQVLDEIGTRPGVSYLAKVVRGDGAGEGGHGAPRAGYPPAADTRPPRQGGHK